MRWEHELNSSVLFITVEWVSMENLYYTAPSDEIFLEVLEAALEIWASYDDTHGYATEKINRIKDLKNISDNVMYIVAMFDTPNQNRLANKLSPEARQALRDRMIAGGNDESLIPF